jgi:hypothetical protein
METDSSDTPRTVTITAVKDEAGKRTIAENLSRITSGHPPVERVLARLDTLPWRLTRNASVASAKKLATLLEGLGASVQISPPLPADIVSDSQAPMKTPQAPTVAVPSENRQRPPDVAAAPQVFPRPERPALSEKDQMRDSGEFLLEPLSLGGILDRTFQICRSHFWKLLAIASIPVLIAAGIALVGIMVVLLAGLTWQALGGLPQWIIIAGALLLIPSIVVFVVALFYLSQGAMIHAVSFIYLSRNIVVKEAYRFVTGKLGRFVLTSFLFAAAASGFVFAPVLLGVGAFFAFTLFDISGWWSAVTWPFLMLIPAYGITKLLLFDKVVIIEDTAYLGALKRSWHLIEGKADRGWPKTYFMRLIVLLHLFVLIYWTIALVFQTPAALVAAITSEHVIIARIFEQLLSTLGSLVAGLFGSVCLVVFYYDLRNRKEGFDLKMLAAMDQE